MQSYELLEKEWIDFGKMPYPVCCSTGSSALRLALESLSLPLGSQILVPEFTYIACPRSVVESSLAPQFIDCGDDLLMNIDDLRSSLCRWTKAIMPVHIYGRRCNMDVIAQFADDFDLTVIEDLSEAHGIDPHERTDVATWSFYKNKIVAGEEGGMVAFRVEEQACKARLLRNQGSDERGDYLHLPRGMNARLSNANADQILRSLSYVDENIYDRFQIQNWYDDHIVNEWKQSPRDVCWAYDVRIPECRNLDGIVNDLKSQGIAARHGFKPMSMQPEFRSSSFRLLKAYKASREVLILPCIPGMREDHISKYCRALEKAVVAGLPSSNVNSH